MKTIHLPYRALCALILLMYGTIGCRESRHHDLVPSGDTTITVALKTAMPHFDESGVSLRADLGQSVENKVTDAIVAIFNPNGQLFDVVVCLPEDFKDPDDLAINGHAKPIYKRSAGGSHDPVVVEVVKGSTIAFLANTSSSLIAPIDGITGHLSASDADEVIKARVKARVQTLDDFRRLQIKLADFNADVPRSLFFTAETLPMYGEEVIDPAHYTTPADGSPVDVTVPLKRLVSKIKLNLTVEPSDQDQPHLSELMYEPTSIEVMNLPANAYIGSVMDPALRSVAAADHPIMYHSLPEQVESYEVTGDGPDRQITCSVTFYTLPNTRRPQHEVQHYADRDEWNKEDTSDAYSGPNGGVYQLNTRFKNAPIHGTYVRIKGVMQKVYTQGATGADTGSYSADLTSYVHLGFVKGNVNNYELDPNVYYTYHLVTKGVKTIIDEVKADRETRPGYEGEITYLNLNKEFVVDAHYDAVLLTFDRSQVTDGLNYKTVTPFSDGDDHRDAHWVSFVSNKIEKERRAGGGTNLPMISDVTALVVDYPGTSEVLTIEQLITQLKDASSPIWSSDGKAYVTAFIDEYYYDRQPGQSADETFKMIGWKTFTNKPDRHFYIYDTNGLAYSRDRQSSIRTALYSIRQHSIQTFYPSDAPYSSGDYIAMGFEKEQDPQRYKLISGIPNNKRPLSRSMSNGRANYWAILDHDARRRYRLHREHSDSHIVLAEGATNSGDLNARLACLAKNRDENGDGIIDRNEMKWYLPSLREMLTMAIADHALPAPLRLLPSTDLDRYYHYLTSTQMGPKLYNSALYWVETGAYSRPLYDPVLRGNREEIDWQVIRYFYGANYAIGNEGNPYYRCVRALGDTTSYSNGNSFEPTTSMFEKIKRTVTKPSGENAWQGYTIKVHLPEKYLRSERKTDEPLPAHDQNSEWNLPRPAFDVAAGCLKVAERKTKADNGAIETHDFSSLWNDRDRPYHWSQEYISNRLYQDPCTYYYYEKSDKSDKGSWRMPNMRELSIMFMVLGVDDSNIPLAPNSDEIQNKGFHTFDENRYSYYTFYRWFAPSRILNCLYYSATRLSKPDDGRFRTKDVAPDAPDNAEVYYYLGYTKGREDVPRAELLNPYNTNGYIRCVRDAK